MTQRRPLSVGSWALLLVLVALLGGGSSLPGQTTDPKIPASSPVWWTLTDDISPQELRRVYGDREASRRRYLLAVEKRLARPVSPERLESLVFYQNGAQSPELLPMYEAFDMYALRFRYRPGWPSEAPDELLEYGFSPGAVETVIGNALRLLEEVDALIEEVKDGQQGFVEVMRKAKPTLGNEELHRALEREDVAALSIASGVPVPEVRRLMDDWEVDPLTSVGADLLPELKWELGESEWERLRSYLLHEIAPFTSAVEFKDEG